MNPTVINTTLASLKLIAAERLHGLLTGYSQRGEAEADCARIAYNPVFPLSQSDNTIRHSVGCRCKIDVKYDLLSNIQRLIMVQNGSI